MSRAAVRVGWLLAAVLALTSVARWVHLDQHNSYLIAASTGAPVLLTLAWPLAFLALALRARWLALTAIALTVVELLLLAPLVAGGRQATTKQITSLRVFELNVYNKASDGPAVSRQIRAARPDVVVLSELTYVNQAGLDISQLPFSTTLVPRESSGGGIWSRYPLEHKDLRRIGDTRMVEADVRLPDGRLVHVQQVHTQSPTSGPHTVIWHQGLRDLKAEEAQLRDPAIIVGDFNASRTDRGFAALLHDGWADAADGRGLLPTWPSGKSWIWPVLRLDHVLVSRSIGVAHVEVLGPTGSDHRAVVADLRL